MRKFTKYPSNYVKATHYTEYEYNTYWRDYDKVIGTILKFLRLKSGPISQKELYDYLHASGFPNIDPETVGKAWDHALSIYQSELSDDADIEACGSVECSTRIQASDDYPDGQTFNELCDYYASFDNMSLEQIWDEVNAKYGEGAANDVVEYIDSFRGEEYFIEDGEEDGNCSWM